MVYVVSDLHGQYDKYRAILEKIAFSDADELYVLGDVVDRGEGSAEILTDMSMRANVFPIMGNHDLTAAILLKKLCVEITEENYENHLTPELLKILAMWQMDGGQATLDSFKKLPAEEREALIEYLEEFSPYEALTVGKNRFVLVHGGIPFDKRSVPLTEQSVHEMVITRPDYGLRYFENTFLVTGHTPTLHIGTQYRGRIYRKNGHIAVDCGAGFGLPLGCIRLDDFEEFYVE